MSNHQHSRQFNYAQRERMLPAEKILLRFGLKLGQHLADLGCGQGYFALKAAEIVGAEGIVKAVEINRERLEILQQAAQERGLAARIKTCLAQEERIPLADQDVDRALISTVLHELHDPLNYLRDTQRILRTNGEVWVIEWQKKEMAMGPPLSERLSVEEWVRMLEEAGFKDIWAQVFAPAHILLRGKVNVSE